MRLFIAAMISISAGIGAGCVAYALYMPIYDGPGVRWDKGRGDYNMRIDVAPENEQQLARAENRAIIMGVGTGFIVAGSTAAAIYLFSLMVNAIEHFVGRSRCGPPT